MALDGNSRLVVEVPIELKKSFKLYCTSNEVHMKEVLEKLVVDFLNEKNWPVSAPSETENS